MSRLFRPAPLLAVAAALTLAACGSSSSSKTTAPKPSSPAAQTPSTPGTPTSTAPAAGAAYPAALRAAFLKGCEPKASAAKCECAINYIQAHTPLSQFVVDVRQEETTHKLPASLQSAVTACKNK